MTSTLAPEVAALVRQGPPSVRLAAARTLGQINPDPDVAIAAVNGLLGSKEISQRKAAADVLINLMKIVAQLATHNHTPGNVKVTRADVVKMGRTDHTAGGPRHARFRSHSPKTLR